MKGLKVNIKLAAKIPSEAVQLSEEEENRKAKLQCSQIYDNIFLSGYNVSQDQEFLAKNEISYVLNCAAGSRNFKTELFKGIKYLLLDLKDDPGFDLIYAIYSTIDFIENAVKIDGKVLIHCFEGISRGPALLASYLMWKYNITKEAAIKRIKEKRKCIEINLGFMVQLSKWEELLNYHSSKELKFFNFEAGGNISLLDKNELALSKDVKFDSGRFSIMLMLQSNKFYKIVTNSLLSNDPFLLEKVNHFVYLLQTYENYPVDCTSLYLDTNLFSKNFFELHFEEILKYSC